MENLLDNTSTIKIKKQKSFFKTLLSYIGPGALVAVGYMDPGNWSTSITGGQYFKYPLLSIILISSLLAMFLQALAAKLGVITQMDLAQATKKYTHKTMNIIMWIIAELAIMATDIAEVLGAAIALYLLFDIPLLLAVLLTVLDVFLLLLLTKIGFRKIEAIVMCLIAVILGVFTYQIILSNPNWVDVLKGFIPSKFALNQTHIINDQTPLSASLGIIGATIMPHNLYLHSSISQIRQIPDRNQKDLKKHLQMTILESNIQLSIAFVVNVLLLIMGVAVFKNNSIQDSSFFGLYEALNNPHLMQNNVLANIAKTGILSTLFAIALLASGQNSTITGTLTGQIVMEGFINLKIPLWLRRLVTRLCAIIPVVLCMLFIPHHNQLQEHNILNQLMIDSQIFLAIALPFSIIPLLLLTSSKRIMGEFKNGIFTQLLGWITTFTLLFLNLQNIQSQLQDILENIMKHQTINLISNLTIIFILICLVILTIDMLHQIKKDKTLEY